MVGHKNISLYISYKTTFLTRIYQSQLLFGFDFLILGVKHNTCFERQKHNAMMAL